MWTVVDMGIGSWILGIIAAVLASAGFVFGTVPLVRMWVARASTRTTPEREPASITMSDVDPVVAMTAAL